jgi:hypothetical protein
VCPVPATINNTATLGFTSYLFPLLLRTFFIPTYISMLKGTILNNSLEIYCMNRIWKKALTFLATWTSVKIIWIPCVPTVWNHSSPPAVCIAYSMPVLIAVAITGLVAAPVLTCLLLSIPMSTSITNIVFRWGNPHQSSNMYLILRPLNRNGHPIS